MSTIEITPIIETLKDLETLIEEGKAEVETLRAQIKTEMGQLECHNGLVYLQFQR